MNLIELRNEFLEENPDYSNDIVNFFDYIVTEKKLDLAANTYIVNAIDTDEVVKSLVYNIENGRIKKQEPARKYIVAIGQLFEFLLQNPQYRNSDFQQELANPSTRERSYKRITKDFIDNCENLLPKESYRSLNNEDVEQIIKWSNEKIFAAMQDNCIATDRIGFKRLVAALCMKTMILTGMTYRIARNLMLNDLDIAKNILQINGYELRLPLTLTEQFQFYRKLRTRIGFADPKTYLFIKQSGKQWGDATGDSGIPNFLKTIIDKTDITGMSKYGISQLIVCGLNDSVIMELTGASKEFLASCLQEIKNTNAKIDMNRQVNSKLVLSEQYYNL